MELITILVIIVSVLTLLSGVTVFVGAEKSARPKALFFLLTTLFAAFWAFAIIVFLNLQPGKNGTARVFIFLMYVAPLLMMLAQVFYNGWGKKLYMFLGVLYGVAMVFLMTMVAVNSTAFYEGFTLDNVSGNSVYFGNGVLFVSYFTLVGLMLATFVTSAISNAKKADSKRLKLGNTFFATGLLLTGAVSILFNLVLPILGNYSLVYVGPLTLSVAAILHFYAILKYRIIVLSSSWLKFGSYVILMAMAAIVYMVIFFTIFKALFKIKDINVDIIVMNFIMILIVLLILPVFNEISGFIRSLISVQQINMEFIVKKLNRMAAQDVDLDELAAFLADNLHFRYIGLIVGGKVYGSEKMEFSKEQTTEISMLEPDGHKVWQKVEGHPKALFEEKNIEAVAELRNAKGRPFGQMLVGQPYGKISFEKRDLAQMEMIINLVASIIDSEKRLKA